MDESGISRTRAAFCLPASLAGMSTKREIVIRRRSDTFAFKLPEGHELELVDVQHEQGRQFVHLRVPGVAGETCAIVSIEERDEEIEYVVEPAGTSHSVGSQPLGYPWPLIQDEQARLRAEWEAAGGDVTWFDSWAQGASHESQFRQWRDGLRRLRRGEQP